MMKIFAWVTVFVCLIVISQVWRFRHHLDRLTLIFSWRWAVLASVVVTVATLTTGAIWTVASGWQSAAALMAVVTLLTPAISTLGARKPGVFAWQFFVVSPLILVLPWPGLSQLMGTHGREAIELSGPAMSGVLLVLLMCVSTGIGTRLTVPTLIYAAGVCLWLLPLSGWVAADSALPLVAPWLLWAAVAGAREIVAQHETAIRNAQSASEIIDESWRLFQTLYGLVWARRFQDRVNQFAGREQWTVHLTAEGFRDASGKSVEDAQLEKPLEAFRWMLRRFADDSWLDSRLCRLG
jgi:hypothetical protein